VTRIGQLTNHWLADLRLVAELSAWCCETWYYSNVKDCFTIC